MLPYESLVNELAIDITSQLAACMRANININTSHAPTVAASRLSTIFIACMQ